MPEIAISQVMQFHSDAVDDGDLMVSALAGTEAINKPYEFHLELVSEKADIDLAKLIKEPAWIGIKQGVQLAGSGKRASTTLKIHGVIESFEQVGKEMALVKYRAVLVPKLKRLALAHQSRIFQDITVPDMVKQICDDHEVEIDTGKLGSYDKREYIVQYEESDLDFIHRWLEHEGIFYYFVQDESHEKLVLADTPEGYGALQSNEAYAYRPRTSGKGRVEGGDSEEAGDDWFKEEVVSLLSCTVNQLPKEVVLNDYNWRDPDTRLECTEQVSKDGKGTVYEYNNHYQTTDQGKKLAKVRAEEINSREKLFRGSSDVRGFRAGMVFELKEHFVKEFNQEYLLVEVSHAASQSISLDSGQASGATYENSFLAIPKSKQFRPASSTPWPSIKGVMHGIIDGGDDSTPYAQIDDKGRYKVKLPLDRGDSQAGSASRWVRKAENYAGPGQGMHFPLLKGAEVLITHVDGDPDRPIISASIFNEKNTSVVNNNNVVENRLHTPAGHEVILDDTQGAGGIKIFTTDQKNSIKMDATGGSEAISIKCNVTGAIIRMGKSQGESSGAKATSSDGVYISTSGELNLFSTGSNVNIESSANFNQECGGNAVIHIAGTKQETVDGTSNWKVSGHSAAYTYGDWFTFNAAAKVATSVGATATAQVGAEAKVAYALSASCVRGDGIAATWGASLKYDKSKSFTIGSDVWGLFIKSKIEQKALTAINLDSAGTVMIEAGTKLTLKCGGSKIELTPAGIKLQNGGSRQTMNSSLARLKAASIEVKATGSLNCKGTPGGQYK